MKNKGAWILAATVAAAMLGLLALKVWFTSPGIRVIGNDIHIELSRKCYIIDEASGEVVDETTVSINGSTNRSDPKLFDGEMKVLGYQNSASGRVSALMSIQRESDDCWMIEHIENCVHQENNDGIIRDVEHFCDYYYHYYIYPNQPEQLIVLIDSFQVSEPQYAVCADTEEEALERYAAFVE